MRNHCIKKYKPRYVNTQLENFLKNLLKNWIFRDQTITLFVEEKKILKKILALVYKKY